MPKYVIDTNVAIVANGDSERVTIDCRLAAVQLLQDAVDKGMIFVDSAGAIQDEYRRHLNPRGEPGIGDRFYLEVINSDPKRVARIDVEKDVDGHYIDLPPDIVESTFDHGDRVFAAVAKKSKAKVYNSVDTDWVEHQALIESCGIPIVFLCGADPAEWREEL